MRAVCFLFTFILISLFLLFTSFPSRLPHILEEFDASPRPAGLYLRSSLFQLHVLSAWPDNRELGCVFFTVHCCVRTGVSVTRCPGDIKQYFVSAWASEAEPGGVVL